jgi:hypothetical protein
VYAWQLTFERGVKENTSEFFSTRDYRIRSVSVDPKFSVQPNVSFRITTGYRYQSRDNVAGQQTEFNTGSLEIRYAPVSKGSYSAKLSIIDIAYNAPENTSIAYEMLEGLLPGTNYTWGLGLQRTLSKTIQVSVNYEGRKPEGIKTIHTGTMQARAFF